MGQAGWPYFWIAYDLLLFGMALVTFKLGVSARGLRVSRKFDPVLSVRASNRIELAVSNEGLEPVRGLIRDEPPPRFAATRKEFPLDLQPGRIAELSYSVTPFERGSDYFRGSWLKVRCPLGLVERQERLPTNQPVRVYPNVLALREFDLLKHKGQLRQIGIRRSRMRGLGTEFESLRDYSEGDDYRKVDWKDTARRSKLVVRQYEQERNQSVLIVIDLGRKMLSEIEDVTKLDHVLDSCLMLTHAANAAGDLVGLVLFSDAVQRYLPPRKGRSQMGIVIEAIHDAVAEPVESDPVGAMAYLGSRWKRRSLIVVFTDAEDPDAAKDLVLALGPAAKRHIVLLARIADPGLQGMAGARLESADAMYGSAAALMLLQERKVAAAELESSGIHTLESEPRDLAAALVSFYFEVKERSLL
jgi:uncharacterized protein (DUF58 family)